MILIENKKGEQQLVKSLDGYEGWTVVDPDFDLPPSDFCQVVDGEWVEDEDAASEAAIVGAGPLERFRELEARIAELEGMMMVLAPVMEAQLAKEAADGSV